MTEPDFNDSDPLNDDPLSGADESAVSGMRAEPRPQSKAQKKPKAKKKRAVKSRTSAKSATKDEAVLTATASWLTLPHMVFFLLMIAFLMLQARLWFGEGSLAEVWQLRNAIETQRAENQAIAERNQRLSAEVNDLKDTSSLSAIEERARSRLGMIKDDEVFYLMIDTE